MLQRVPLQRDPKTHWRFHDLHLPHASGDRAGSPGRVPEMRDASGAEIYRSRGGGTKGNAIVIAKILDRAGAHDPGAIPVNGSCHSWLENRFNCPKANRKMD